MYADAELDRRRLLSEILNAATGYVDGLADAAVRARLETLLRIDPRRLLATDDRVGLASEIVREAQAVGRERGLVSFYGDLADRALFATLARSAVEHESLANPAESTRTFTREILGFAIDHLVSRDLTAHIGAASIPNAASANGLRSELVEAARALADETVITPRLQPASESPRRAWRRLIATAWKAGRDLPVAG